MIVFPSLTARAAQGLQRPVVLAQTLAQTQPRSFFQRERDKLTYSPESKLGWPGAAGSDGFLDWTGGKKGQQEVVAPVAPVAEPIEMSRDRTPPVQAQQRLDQLKKTVTTKFHPENKSKQQPKQQTASLTPQQKREIRRRNRPDFLKSKVDPYDLVRAAREKHSPLQGHHLSFDSLNFIKPLNFTRQNIPAVVQQVPEQINQLKNTVNTKVSETIQQQPEPVKIVLTQPIGQTLSETTKQLKGKAATQLIEPTNKAQSLFETIFETKIKAPLRQLLHAMGELAHQTAQQLD